MKNLLLLLSFCLLTVTGFAQTRDTSRHAAVDYEYAIAYMKRSDKRVNDSDDVYAMSKTEDLYVVVYEDGTVKQFSNLRNSRHNVNDLHLFTLKIINEMEAQGYELATGFNIHPSFSYDTSVYPHLIFKKRKRQ